jgi:hypothetical protein
MKALTIAIFILTFIGIKSYSNELPDSIIATIEYSKKEITLKTENSFSNAIVLGKTDKINLKNTSKKPNDLTITSIYLIKRDFNKLDTIFHIINDKDYIVKSGKSVSISIGDFNLKGLDLINLDVGYYYLAVTNNFEKTNFTLVFSYNHLKNFQVTIISVVSKEYGGEFSIHRSKNKYDELKIGHNDILSIKSKFGNPIEITIKILNRWDENQIKKEITKISNSFDFSVEKLIEKRDLQRTDITHGDYFVIKFRNGDETGEIVFEYERKISPQIARVYSPILFRMQGKLSDFTYKDIAPSVGLGICQINFKEEKFQYIKANMLISTFQINTNDSTSLEPRYALHLGGYFDFGGYLSVGALYEFDNKKTFLTLGIRVEELYKVIFRK